MAGSLERHADCAYLAVCAALTTRLDSGPTRDGVNPAHGGSDCASICRMSAEQLWGRPSAARFFSERRARLLAVLEGPALLYAGLPRPRNFPHNVYPFRAESHFLYLVGKNLEGAALLLEGRTCTLYVPRRPAESELWAGPIPTLEQLENELGVEVRLLEDLTVPEGTATLPPQDGGSAAALGKLLGREVEAGSGDVVRGRDAQLAARMISVRLKQDEAAIEQLRQAAAVTVAAHRAGMARTRPGLREAHVRAAMEGCMLEAGMVPAYPSIVTKHGEVLHNDVHTHVLQAGDLLLADAGAESCEGWAADVTRTWPVNGRFSATQRAIYEVVLHAQSKAIDAVTPGARYLDVHRAAGRALLDGLLDLGIVAGDRELLYQGGIAALFFPHGIGHLLGLDVHDMEDLGDRAGYAPGRERSDVLGDRHLRLDRDLEVGMVVTIEPGFYLIDALLEQREGLGDLQSAVRWDELERYRDVRGIRIEDDVLVTEQGCEVLTRALPKAPDEIEQLVGS